MMMTPDELRVLADALPEGVHWSDPITPDMLAEAIRRFCADAQPVAWMYEHDGCVDTPLVTVNRWTKCEEPWNESPLFPHPAPAVPQAEPKREDQPLRDLLAVIHRDGGHHTEAVGIEQSIKDAQAAVCELKRELAMEKREPLHELPPLPEPGAYAYEWRLQTGSVYRSFSARHYNGVPCDDQVLFFTADQMREYARTVLRTHGIGGSDE